ncbi:MAG: putative baseplate assembly protein [Acidimicrobiia bacterium]
MALPAPDLDDRRFQDLVDEAKRLIPRYCPEWTNHNLSDPGVALIELFAWMSEMVLFRVNQVPDKLYTKFLDLVGIEPFPPAVATADLTFFLSGIVDEPVVVPAGTEVATAEASTGTVVFTTSTDLTIAQPLLVAALTSTGRGTAERFTDVWDALRYERDSVTCFTSRPLAPGDAVLFGFAEPIGGQLLLLQVSASIEGIGVDPDRPPLAWESWTGEGWAPATVNRDTTGGLNRDGAVELLVARQDEALTLGGARAHWLRARLLDAVEGQPPYQASPQIRDLTVASLGGTVRADHCERTGAEVLGRSDGRPGQELRVRQAPVLPRGEGEHVEVVGPDGVEVWAEVPDFSRSGPTDRHVTWDGASGTIRFGPSVRYADGRVAQHGAVPREGAEVRVTGYRHGGGARGNLGATTLTSLRRSIPFVSRVTNLAPATGGVDGETVENAKLRGPMTLRTGGRAVTAADYERLTREASTEVARARCLPPGEPGGPVRLLVVPDARTRPDELRLDDLALSDDLVATIAAHLEPRRVLGTTVEIGTPYYQGVTVAALVQVLPGRPANLVRQRALDLLYRYVHPLVGGPDGNGWPDDTDLNAASVGQLLEAIEGVDRVEEVLLFEYDLRTGTRHGQARERIRLDGNSLFLSASHQVVVRA